MHSETQIYAPAEPVHYITVADKLRAGGRSPGNKAVFWNNLTEGDEQRRVEHAGDATFLRQS